MRPFGAGPESLLRSWLWIPGCRRKRAPECVVLASATILFTPPPLRHEGAPAAERGRYRGSCRHIRCFDHEPFTPLPSTKRMGPIDSGGGLAATNFPTLPPTCQSSTRSTNPPPARPQHARVWVGCGGAHKAPGIRRSPSASTGGRRKRLQCAVERHARMCAPTHRDRDLVSAQALRKSRAAAAAGFGLPMASCRYPH